MDIPAVFGTIHCSSAHIHVQVHGHIPLHTHQCVYVRMCKDMHTHRCANKKRTHVCIIKDGDVGKADILVGNAHMWSDHWGGCIDCNENLMKFRKADDDLGPLEPSRGPAVPVDWQLNYKDVFGNRR